jgi:hypothetical protein
MSSTIQIVIILICAYAGAAIEAAQLEELRESYHASSQPAPER